MVEDNMTQPPSSRKSTGLADLNEPIVLEESNEPDPEIDNVVSHVTDYTEVSCQYLPGKTNLDTQVQPKEIIQNPQMHQACSNILDVVKMESQPDWTNSLFKSNEAGQSGSVLDSFPDGNSETFSISSGDSEFEQAPEVSSSNSFDNSSSESHSNGQAFGSMSSDDDCPELVAEACEYTSNQLVPLANVEANESLLAPWRKHDNAFVKREAQDNLLFLLSSQNCSLILFNFVQLNNMLFTSEVQHKRTLVCAPNITNVTPRLLVWRACTTFPDMF